MSVTRPALVCLAVLISAVIAQSASAQKMRSVGVSRPAASAPPSAPPTRGGGNGGTRGSGDGGYRGGGRFGGWGGVATGVIGGVLSAIPPDRVIDDGPDDDGYGPPRRLHGGRRRPLGGAIPMRRRPASGAWCPTRW